MHRLCHCPRFRSMLSAERRNFASAWKGCSNCLGGNHKVKDCPSAFNCRYCGQRHHSLIHPENEGFAVRQDSVSHAKGETKSTGRSDSFVGLGCSTFTSRDPPYTVLLGTVKTLVRGSRGRILSCRAVLDCGSQRSFITKQLAAQLGEFITPCSGAITGLGGGSLARPLGSVSCALLPRPSSDELRVHCLVVDKISSNLPSSNISKVEFRPVQHEPLADDEFFLSKPVDMLLGCDLYPRLITGAPYSSGIDEIYFIPSLFGLVVVGGAGDQTADCEVSLFSRDDMDTQLRAFWEIEEPLIVPRTSPQDAYCEDHFRKSHTRTAEGRYCVELPLADNPASVGENREAATRRFFALERRMCKDTELANSYSEFMQEYMDLRHMSPAPSPSSYLIPHHPVWQQGQRGTKLRVVFDASSPSTAKSLNDVLLAGPKLQKDLPNVLTLFRLYAIPLCADLVKMYRQILVHPDHRHLQHILWRKNPSEQLEEFCLNTVTYGLKSSAFLAMRVIKQLVEDEGGAFPLASSRISNSMYVDDIVTGANSIPEALALRQELCELFAKGGFTLGKWASTLPEVLKGLDGSVFDSLDLAGETITMKILGMVWSTHNDAFTFTVRQPPVQCATKRTILSAVARIFDPLGLLAPVILLAKILLQDLWKAHVDWDEPLPMSLTNDWRQLATEWAELTHISVPRYIGAHNVSLSLVGFCDASDKAYAAALYVRAEDSEGFVRVSLMKAKSKVAPVKYLSTARLELCGALLLTQLVDSVELPSGSVRTMRFTDSMVVLSWLRTPTHALRTFEANRVSKILESTALDEWQYVCSRDNPSDIASRGCLPDKLKDNSLWWSGPEWVSRPESDWPKQPSFPSKHQETVTLLSKAHPPQKEEKHSDQWMQRFSSYQMLVRVTAWLLRFRRVVGDRAHPLRGQISAEEYREAQERCSYIAQRAHFPASLFSRGVIPNELRQLSPFLDTHGILRVGGRLTNASLHFSRKHPILIPRYSHLAELIVDDTHVRHYHSGPTLTLALVRGRFWIPGGLKFVRSRILKCIPCRIRNAKPLQPLMADLPNERVTPTRPFTHTGVDYAGPFSIKESNRRGAALGKAYLCIFVCMSTRAVHLEAVSSLSTPAFLASLERFIARRGLPQTIWSDNGTNFVGASRFLKDVGLWFSHNESEISRVIAPRGIEWRFIPPRAPNFGGLWESAVKSAKTLLVRSFGKQIHNFEELTTVFARIESILNSRPLCSISEDPHQCDFLTPGHFLIGGPLTTIPEPDSDSDHHIRSPKWRDMQSRIAVIWSRWRKEYLHTLLQRAKWHGNHEGIQVGDLVIMSERKCLVGHWPVGRVVETHPGGDSVVRVVTVLAPDGRRFVRAASSLVPLLAEKVSNGLAVPCGEDSPVNAS